MAQERILANFQFEFIANVAENMVDEVSREKFGELRIRFVSRSSVQEFSHTIRIPSA